MKQEINKDGKHRLIDEETGETTPWVPYRSATFLNGKVGITGYYSEKGEMIVSPEEFCAIFCIGKQEQTTESSKC